jgi:hypothetical protein
VGSLVCSGPAAWSDDAAQANAKPIVNVDKQLMARTMPHSFASMKIYRRPYSGHVRSSSEISASVTGPLVTIFPKA